jgi:hypothetical protein
VKILPKYNNEIALNNVEHHKIKIKTRKKKGKSNSVEGFQRTNYVGSYRDIHNPKIVCDQLEKEFQNIGIFKDDLVLRAGQVDIKHSLIRDEKIIGNVSTFHKDQALTLEEYNKFKRKNKLLEFIMVFDDLFSGKGQKMMLYCKKKRKNLTSKCSINIRNIYYILYQYI